MSQVRFRLVVNERTTIEGYANYTSEWGVYHHVEFTPTLVVYTTRQGGKKYRVPPEWLWQAVPPSWVRQLHYRVAHQLGVEPKYHPEWVVLTP